MQETTTEIRFASPKRYIEESLIFKKSQLGEVGFLSGNEACAYGALAAGLSFYAGYPITPSTEIAEILSYRMPALGRVFIQMEDEIASMGAIIGASLTGRKSMTATSGPGFSLMQENLGYACIAEVPCVVVNVQRGGPSTGSPTSPAQGDLMQARWGTHGDHPIIALYPASVQEAFELTMVAFNLAEKYRTPVVFLMDEVIGHMREKVVFPKEGQIPVLERRKPPKGLERFQPFAEDGGLVPPMAAFGEGYRYHVTGLHHDPAGYPTLRPDEINRWFERVFAKIEQNLDEILLYREEDLEDAETVVVSCGITARSARAAARSARARGQKVGTLTLQTIWPFPEKVLRQLGSRVRRILVPELNRGQLILEIQRCVRNPEVEIRGINRLDGGVITPAQILEKLEERSWPGNSH